MSETITEAEYEAMEKIRKQGLASGRGVPRGVRRALAKRGLVGADTRYWLTPAGLEALHQYEREHVRTR